MWFLRWRGRSIRSAVVFVRIRRVSWRCWETCWCRGRYARWRQFIVQHLPAVPGGRIRRVSVIGRWPVIHQRMLLLLLLLRRMRGRRHHRLVLWSSKIWWLVLLRRVSRIMYSWSAYMRLWRRRLVMRRFWRMRWVCDVVSIAAVGRVGSKVADRWGWQAHEPCLSCSGWWWWWQMRCSVRLRRWWHHTTSSRVVTVRLVVVVMMTQRRGRRGRRGSIGCSSSQAMSVSGMWIRIVTWTSAADDERRRVASCYQDWFSVAGIGIETNNDFVVLLCRAPFAVVCCGSLELHSLKGNNVVARAYGSEVQVATCAHGLRFRYHLWTFVSFWGMLHEFNFLVGIIGYAGADTDWEVINLVKFLLLLVWFPQQARHLGALQEVIDAVDVKSRADLKVVATVTCPVLICPEKSAVHLGLKLHLVSLILTVRSTNKTPRKIFDDFLPIGLI